MCTRYFIERIAILRRYIKILPVPQNYLENDNQKPNNYPNLQVSKPKQKERFTTSSKIVGNRLDKSTSKAFRNQALVRYGNNMEKMRETQELKAWEAAKAENEAKYEKYLKEMGEI